MKFILLFLLTFVAFVAGSAIPGPKAEGNDASDKYLAERDDGVCHSNRDCQGGWCWEGICRDGRCRHNGDCPTNYYCFRGNCTHIPRKARDADAGDVDESDNTVDTEMCSADLIDIVIDAPPTPCKHDNECKRCQHCIEGQCGYRHGTADDESDLM